MKKYIINIYFTTGSDTFLGYAKDAVKLEVDEDVKNQIVDAMSSPNDNFINAKLLAINLNETDTKFINMGNVLYIDVKEVENAE